MLNVNACFGHKFNFCIMQQLFTPQLCYPKAEVNDTLFFQVISLHLVFENIEPSILFVAIPRLELKPLCYQVCRGDVSKTRTQTFSFFQHFSGGCFVKIAPFLLSQIPSMYGLEVKACVNKNS